MLETAIAISGLLLTVITMFSGLIYREFVKLNHKLLDLDKRIYVIERFLKVPNDNSGDRFHIWPECEVSR